jgi:hypothetical protein
VIKNFVIKISTICTGLICCMYANAQVANTLVLFPGSDVYLPPGASIQLLVENITELSVNRAVISNAQWTVNGHSPDQMNPETDGRISVSSADFLKQNAVASYTAPDDVAEETSITVAVAVTTPGITEKDLLFCHVHIRLRQNFFYVGAAVSHDGQEFIFHEPVLSSQRKMFEKATYMNGEWNVMVSGHDSKMNTLGINLSFTVSEPGTYPWKITWTNKTGVRPPSITASVVCSNPMFQYMSVHCVPPGDPKCTTETLEGNTTITTFNTKTGEMKGYFAGRMFDGKIYQFVSGAFSVYTN